MILRRTVLACLACSFLAAPALATPSHKQVPGAHGKRAPEQRRLRALQKAGVDDARAKRAVEAVQRFAAERRKLREQLATHRRVLDGLLAAKSGDEKAFARELAAMRAARKKMFELRERELDAVSQILKPSEMARLRVHRAGRGDGRQRGPRGRAHGRSRGQNSLF